MSVIIVTTRVHPDNVETVVNEVRKTFTAIAAADPEAGYAICRGDDRATFVAILDLPGQNNPLIEVPAFVELQQALRAWRAEPSTSHTWEIVGSHRLFQRVAGAGRRSPVRTSRESSE